MRRFNASAPAPASVSASIDASSPGSCEVASSSAVQCALGRPGGVAPVPVELLVEARPRRRAEPRAADEHARAVPPAARYASVSSRHRSGDDNESNSTPAPSAAARRTAANPIAGAHDRHRLLRARLHRRIIGEEPRVGAVEHPGDARERVGEPLGEIVHRGAHDLEVVPQRACRHAQPHATREPRRHPRRLLGDQRRRPEGKQQRARRGPPVGHRLEAPPGRLQGVGEVAGEPAVVLARHHPVEAVLGGERCLRPELVDDPGRGAVVVRVQAQRHRARRER